MNYAISPQEIQAGVISSCAVLVSLGLGYVMGKSKQRAQEERKLKQLRFEKECEENAQEKIRRQEHSEKEKSTELFHQLTHMQQTIRCFAPFIKQSMVPEQFNDQQHRTFLHEVLAAAGSVQKFEQQLNKHITDYEKFEPTMATKHKELLDQLLWIKRALHINHYVPAQRKLENQQAFEQATRKAHLQKEQYEAEAAQHLVATICQVKQMATAIQHTSDRTAEKITNRVDALESLMRRSLHELNEWQSRCAHEHRDTTTLLKEQQKALKDLEQKNTESITDNQVTITKKLSEQQKMLEEITKKVESLQKEVAQAKEIPAQPTSVTSQQVYERPPAYNPGYNPAYKPYIPAQ